MNIFQRSDEHFRDAVRVTGDFNMFLK